MKFIIVNNDGQSRTLNFRVNRYTKVLAVAGIFCVPLLSGWWLGFLQSRSMPEFFRTCLIA